MTERIVCSEEGCSRAVMLDYDGTLDGLRSALGAYGWDIPANSIGVRRCRIHAKEE